MHSLSFFTKSVLRHRRTWYPPSLSEPCRTKSTKLRDNNHLPWQLKWSKKKQPLLHVDESRGHHLESYDKHHIHLFHMSATAEFQQKLRISLQHRWSKKMQPLHWLYFHGTACKLNDKKYIRVSSFLQIICLKRLSVSSQSMDPKEDSQRTSHSKGQSAHTSGINYQVLLLKKEEN